MREGREGRGKGRDGGWEVSREGVRDQGREGGTDGRRGGQEGGWD